MNEYTFFVCVNDAEHEVAVKENDQSKALRKCKEILGVQPDDEFDILEIRTDEISK
ncbi:MAG: hypothetical protein K2J47_01800 [Ruminococcus sp.]|nr:hypothetical protein [Ruminococcus sp.]